MAWIVGIDEAGYGPNLGPFVMSCGRLPRARRPAPTRTCGQPSARPSAAAATPTTAASLVDDSKVVYSSARGLLALERGVLAALGGCLAGAAGRLHALVEHTCADGADDLRGEAWYRGACALPAEPPPTSWPRWRPASPTACAAAGVARLAGADVVLCPPRFNAAGSTPRQQGGGARRTRWGDLLRCGRELASGDDALAVHVDKHGGRNAYAALIQHALPDGVVLAQREGDGPQHLPRRRAGPRRAADVPAAGRRRALLRGAGVDGQQVPARAVDAGVQPLLAGARAGPEADGRLPRRRRPLLRGDPPGGGAAGHRRGRLWRKR